ncbi:hypothetical protein GW756_02480 [bacterium]|nr:hypothetical protein [bacterium]NCQ55659.1 hypothetical protein [Candidatus Parcubacteria bacterium]NCS67484.1 hypothetical protein [Candidatus Peregrinibacteria bacterium]NCS96210.1 hypothetical protein [bacterium]
MKTKTAPEYLEELTTQFVQKKFTIGVILPLTETNRSELFFQTVEPLCDLGFTFSVLAVGDQASQEKCFDLSQKFPDNFELLESIPANRDKVVQKSQVVLFTSSPDKKVIKELSRKGVVPIMPYDDALIEFASFDVQQEQGNCFLYNPENQWECLATIIRAYENFKFPYDWGNLRKNLKKVFEA